MGLSTPLALLGLVLVGVPVLAHLLRRADVRTLRLPTIALLSRAAVESKRRPRIVDPLLLLLRVLLVGLAVLALAAPFTEREISFGDGRVSSVILVIDDSMSMGREVGDSTVFEAARARAREIVDALPEGSEVGVVCAGSPARVHAPRTAELGTVLDLLNGSSLAVGTARGDDLEHALSLAQRQLAGARHERRRVVVLSDFRGSGADALSPDLAGEDVSFERIGDDALLSNVALTAASVEQRGSGARVAFSVRGYGASAPSHVTVRLLRGATELARAEVTLEGGSGRGLLDVGEVATDADPSALLMMDSGPSDAYRADDSRGVLLRPPSAPRVVLVDRLASGEASTRFLERALTLAPREEGGPISVRRVDARSLAGVPVGAADVLVVADVDLRDAPLAEALRAHVEDGAGLLLAAGSHAGPGSESRLSDLFPARITAEAGSVTGLVRESASNFLSASSAPEAGLLLVRVRQRAVLESALVDASEVALRFSDGAPALIVSRERRTAILATGIDDAWSDWPYRPVFLPVMVRAVVALSRPGTMPDEPFAAGAVTELRGPPEAREVSVRAPDGFVRALPVERGRVALTDLSAAGPYAVTFSLADGTSRPSPRSAFVLAAPPAESDPLAFAVPEGTARSEGTEAGPALVRSSLAPWFFLLVGLFCVAEGAFRLRPERSAARGVGATPARAE